MGKTAKIQVCKLVKIYPGKHKAVISDKGASTKYWINSLNTYVNEGFKFKRF